MKINTFDRSLLPSIDKKFSFFKVNSIFYRILENFNIESFITIFSFKELMSVLRY